MASREKGSNAELDYIIQKDNSILPIEVKAGTKGKMQSMHLFLKNKKIDYGLRISLENFQDTTKLKLCPYLQSVIYITFKIKYGKLRIQKQNKYRKIKSYGR